MPSMAPPPQGRIMALLTIVLAFGMRRGEALGLHWSSLNWDEATLKVTHSVKRVQDRSVSVRRTRLVIGPLKTARSRRTLFLTPQLIDMLRRHHLRHAEERMAIGEVWQDHGLIFPSEIGTPLDPDNVSHVFSRICVRGVGALASSRAAAVRGLADVGTGYRSLRCLGEVLGHSSVAITKDVYGHLVEGQKRAAAELMSKALMREGGPRMAPNSLLRRLVMVKALRSRAGASRAVTAACRGSGPVEVMVRDGSPFFVVIDLPMSERVGDGGGMRVSVGVAGRLCGRRLSAVRRGPGFGRAGAGHRPVRPGRARSRPPAGRCRVG